MNDPAGTTSRPQFRFGSWAIAAWALCLVAACDSGAAQGVRDGGATVDGSADGGDVFVRISVQINNCPGVTTSASPLSTSVGDAINVMATGTDSDPGDRLTYLWTAASGLFAEPTAPNTMYICAEYGVHALTVRVSDGRCDDLSVLAVTCL